MHQDDSNGSSSFEIVEKKTTEFGGSNDKSDTLSTLSAISSPYSISSPSSISASLSTAGNILSNVAPPSSIPDFTLWTQAQGTGMTTETIVSTVGAGPPPPQVVPPRLQGSIPATNAGQFPPTQFSAAIPPSKGIPHEATTRRTSQPPEAEVAETPSIIGLVQGAFSNGVLSKMAEKAKSSVNSLITTLDPQMSEYLYSGGDLEITVTTTDEEIISAIRDAVHNVLGKAWVNGINLDQPKEKSQAIGLKIGLENAEAKIASAYKQRKTPTIAVENVLLNENESWFDVSLLLLKDPEKGITLKTFSQATPVPAEKFLEQINTEIKDPLFSIEQKLAEYLKVIPGWQEEVSGVSRKEIILLAAKTLVKLYKDQLSNFAK